MPVSLLHASYHVFTTAELLSSCHLSPRAPTSGLKAPGFDNATLRFQNRAGKGWFPYAAHQDDVRAVDDALTQALVATRSTVHPGPIPPSPSCWSQWSHLVTVVMVTVVTTWSR